MNRSIALALLALAVVAPATLVAADCEVSEDCGPLQRCDDAICFCDLELAHECRDGSCVSLELVNDGYCDCGGDDCSDEEVDRDDRDEPDRDDGDDGEFGSPFDDDEGDSTSSGDPHFRTFDGLYYDFQGLGEFVNCETEQLSVHTCQAPWVHNPTMTAVNRAVSVRFGSTTVTAEYNTAAAAFFFYINGERALEAGPVANADLTATPVGNSLTIETAGGDRVLLRGDTWAQWINVEVHPAAGTSTRGLCGTNNGNHRDDLTLPDGSSVPVGHPWYSINARAQEFGESWRVAEGSSLLPAAVSCPGGADGFESFDFVEFMGRVLLGAAPAGAEPKADHKASVLASLTKVIGERRRRASAQASAPRGPSEVMTSDHVFAAINCLAEHLGVPFDNLVTALHLGGSGAVRLTQVIYDLVFFTFENDSPDVQPLDNCADGHRVITALLNPAVPQPEPDSDVHVARCDSAGSCETASASTSGNRVSLKWASDGEC